MTTELDGGCLKLLGIAQSDEWCRARYDGCDELTVQDAEKTGQPAEMPGKL